MKAKTFKTVKRVKSDDRVVINDDTLREILTRLPVNSLLRFEIVSKHWHNIITDPLFRHALISNQKSHGNGVVLLYSKCKLANMSTIVPPSIEHNINHNSKFAFCNGLLLYCNQYSNKYYICNYTTKKYFLLPVLSIIYSWHAGIGLAFDPAKSPYYKVVVVVRILTSMTLSTFQIFIYSSQTGTWRVSGDPFGGDGYRVAFDRGVYWNGAINWLHKNRLICTSYFKIDNEVLKDMPPLPATIHEYGGANLTANDYFGESRGHLHYIEVKRTIQFHVYELKTDYSEWFVKHRVDLSQMSVRDCHEMVGSIFSIVYGEKDDEAFIILGLQNTEYYSMCKICPFSMLSENFGRVLRCNLASNTWEKLQDVEDRSEYPIMAFHNVESLCYV